MQRRQVLAAVGSLAAAGLAGCGGGGTTETPPTGARVPSGPEDDGGSGDDDGDAGEDMDAEGLRRAYVKAIKENHPDHGGAPDEIDRIKDAYETLKARLAA